MKPNRSPHSRSRCTCRPQRSGRERARILLPVLGVLLVCLLPLLLAQAPSWWAQRGVVNSAPASDFAAANQGQIKTFALAAYEEFLTRVPAALGGIGPDVPPPNPALPESPANRASPGWRLRHLLRQWVQIDAATGAVRKDGTGKPLPALRPPGAPPPTDFAAINLGQIKAVTAPFYDRLAELYWSHNSATPATSTLDPAWAKPWTDATSDDNNHAMANLGQLKRAFALDLDSDADSDGLSNLAELLANANRGLTPEFWTSLANPDSDDDGILDGPEATAGTSPASADSDGDGVPDREDLFPSDGRRSDYIPPKFYAVTDLSAYLPENVRDTFEVEHIALDDNHKVAFFGTSGEPEPATRTGHVFQWQDGELSELKVFPMKKPSWESGQVWPLSPGQFGIFSLFDEAADLTYAYATSTFQVTGVNASGMLAAAISTGYTLWGQNVGYFAFAGAYGSGEWPTDTVPTPGTIHPDPFSIDPNAPDNFRQYGTEFFRTISHIDNSGHKLEWENRWDHNDINGYPIHRFARYFDGQEIPALSEGSSLFLWPPECYGLNSHGAFLVRGLVADLSAQGGNSYAYKYCQGGQVEDAPDGIIQMNGAHQAIGSTSGYENSSFVTHGWFAIETSTGVWDKFPMVDLLKWTNKPAGTRDDYDKFHKQLRYIHPTLMTEADPASAGTVIAGRTSPNGVPRYILFSAQYADDAPNGGGTSETWTSGDFLLVFDTSDVSPNNWHYSLHEVLTTSGLEITALTNGGTVAGFVQEQGAGDINPAFAQEISFDTTEPHGVDFDPPMRGDVHRTPSDQLIRDESDFTAWVSLTSCAESHRREVNDTTVVRIPDFKPSDNYTLVVPPSSAALFSVSSVKTRVMSNNHNFMITAKPNTEGSYEEGRIELRNSADKKVAELRVMLVPLRTIECAFFAVRNSGAENDAFEGQVAADMLGATVPYLTNPKPGHTVGPIDGVADIVNTFQKDFWPTGVEITASGPRANWIDKIIAYDLYRKPDGSHSGLTFIGGQPVEQNAEIQTLLSEVQNDPRHASMNFVLLNTLGYPAILKSQQWSSTGSGGICLPGPEHHRTLFLEAENRIYHDRQRPQWAWYNDGFNGQSDRIGRVALHEFGHSLYLSTRNVNGQIGWGHESFDTWPKEDLPAPAIPPCDIVPYGTSTVLGNWKQSANQCRPDRRMWVPLMYAPPLRGNGLYRHITWQRAFGGFVGRWTRHEDWRTANREAWSRN